MFIRLPRPLEKLFRFLKPKMRATVVEISTNEKLSIETDQVIHLIVDVEMKVPAKRLAFMDAQEMEVFRHLQEAAYEYLKARAMKRLLRHMARSPALQEELERRLSNSRYLQQVYDEIMQEDGN